MALDKNVEEVVEPELKKTLRESLKTYINNEFAEFKDDYKVIEDFIDTQIRRKSKTSSLTKAFSALEERYNLRKFSMPGDYDEKKVFDLYKACSHITQGLMQKDKVDYAIYYQDKNGNLYRVNESFDEMPALHLSGKGELKLQATDIKTANRAMVSITMKNHYLRYVDALNKSYKGKTPIPNKSINAGHTLEAYERDLKQKHPMWLSASQDVTAANNHRWTAAEAWMLFRLSRNIDPWYTGGDVGNTQVKVITTGNVRLTRNSTLTDIAAFLYFLKHNTNSIDIEQLADDTYNVLKPKNDLSWDKMKNYINDDVIEATKQYIENHEFQYNLSK